MSTFFVEPIRRTFGGPGAPGLVRFGAHRLDKFFPAMGYGSRTFLITRSGEAWALECRGTAGLSRHHNNTHPVSDEGFVVMTELGRLSV